MPEEILHLSIGPVQGFVAQARRTRDLWAGSFLLSWLSGQAMNAVIEAGGRVLLPRVHHGACITEPMLAAIGGQPLPDYPHPEIGTLPNRFRAEVPDTFDTAACGQAVRSAWTELADAVWQHFIASAGLDGTQLASSRAIWDRQLPDYWEIQWVRGPRPGKHDTPDLDWLDLRKNWRSHWPSGAEGGDHCSIMGDHQELSGLLRAHEREAQNAFWRQLRRQPDGQAIALGRLELRDDERLCAIALVKRLFPKLPTSMLREAIGWVPGGRDERGRSGTAGWPSTAYMAAVPWLERTAEGDGDERAALTDYFDLVRELCEPNKSFHKLCSEQVTRLDCLAGLREGASARTPDALDGNLYLESALINARSTPLSDRDPSDQQPDPDAGEREALHAALTTLNMKLGRRASPIYALLLMDGDNMGKLLRNDPDDRVPEALGQFALGVSKHVAAHCGKTIYAGGDDVLALLPLHRALDCAMALRAHWGETMAAHQVQQSTGLPATASTALLLAHYRLPLRGVLREAHYQLDDIAKDRNGRDSIAICLWQSGGKRTAWVSTWNDERGEPVVPRLGAFIDQLREDLHQGDRGRYPRGFFHKLRGRYPVLLEEPQRCAGEQAQRLDAAPEEVSSLFVAEYLRTRRGGASCSTEEATLAVDALLDLCFPRVRASGTVRCQTDRLRLEAAFLARFLAVELEGQGQDADRA